MRLLHTSDWHLGRSFHREDLLGAQRAFIDFLVETVEAEGVDVVLVAGDVYDRALPGVDAVALCNRALARLAAAGARVVLTSGNHDSATRLGFGADLIDAAGIHLRTDPSRCADPIVLADAHGPVAVYALPYLEPDAVRAVLGCGGRGHEAVLGAAMTAVRADLTARPAGTRSVVLAHAFVAGAEACESERDITVGGVARVAVGVFAGVDYVALGHLHGAQVLAPGVRYSGSPLAYSFSEAGHRKAVWVVDLDAGGLAGVRALACPVPRPLARVRARLGELLEEPRWACVQGHYLQVTLTDPVRPAAAMERLRRRFPHVLVLAFAPEGPAAPAGSYTEVLRGRDDLQVMTSFVAHVRGGGPDAGEVAVLRGALEAVRRAEALA